MKRRATEQQGFCQVLQKQMWEQPDCRLMRCCLLQLAALLEILLADQAFHMLCTTCHGMQLSQFSAACMS